MIDVKNASIPVSFIFLLTLSGFPFQIKLYIDLFISAMILVEVFGRTVNGYISLGRANVLITVTFPINYYVHMYMYGTID